MNLTEQQHALFEWVKSKHSGQLRKYTNLPYWHHLWSVAEIVDHAIQPGGQLIEIAFCHDLLEDTDCDRDEFQMKLAELGYTQEEVDFIALGVQSLTSQYSKSQYPDLSRNERKHLECERLSKIEANYQSVKYADIINNCSTIAGLDPTFASVYLFEKNEILLVMNQGDSKLYQEAVRAVSDGIKSLEPENNAS